MSSDTMVPAEGKVFSRRTALRVSILGMAAIVAGCAASDSWQMNYPGPLDPALTKTWRVSDVQVVVPASLTTSDENSWTPNYDIVWHGDPAGDRKVQVATLMTTAIKAGTTELRGKKPVVLVATMQQFHAITPKVEQRLQHSGVHDIRFVLQVFDAKTKQPLTEATPIESDAPALVGDAAHEARVRGYTQKDEIVAAVSKVVRGYLGTGPDPRHSFSRLGR